MAVNLTASNYIDLLIDRLNSQSPATRNFHEPYNSNQYERRNIRHVEESSSHLMGNTKLTDEIFDAEIMQVQTSLIQSDRPISQPEFLDDSFWLSPLVGNKSQEETKVSDINDVASDLNFKPKSLNFLYSQREDIYSSDFISKNNQLSNTPYYYDATFPEFTEINNVPLSFWVISKPLTKGFDLAKKLANAWNCEFVDANAVLSGVKSYLPRDTALTIENHLKRGLSIEGELLFELFGFYLNSDLVRRRGYVLYGLPYSSPAMDVYTQFQRIFNFDYLPKIMILYNYPKEEINSRYRGDFIRNAYIDHYQIVELLEYFPELITTLTEYIIDKTFNIIEAENLDAIYYENRFWEVANSDSIELSLIYELTVQHAIDDLLSKINTQNLIILDGRQSIYENIMMIAAYLTINGLLPNKTAKALTHNVLVNMPIEGITELLNEPGEYLSFLKIDNIRTGYYWKYSPWGIYCPYELKKGNLVEGQPEICARYYDKIYFLSSEEAKNNFLQKPQFYLGHPFPIPTCKIAIIGPQLSGKSVMSHLLASIFNATVISYKFVYEETLQAKIKAKLSIVKERERKIILNSRQKIWVAQQTRFIQFMVVKLRQIYNRLSSYYNVRCRNKAYSPSKPFNLTDWILHKLVDATYLANYLIRNPSEIFLLLDNWDLLMHFLPRELFDYPMASYPRAIQPNDSIFMERVERAEHNVYTHTTRLSTHDITGMLIGEIQRAEFVTFLKTKGEMTCGGWIIDGYPTNFKVTDNLTLNGFGPDHIICLRDPTEDQIYSLSVFLKHITYKNTFFQMVRDDPKNATKYNRQNDVHLPLLPSPKYFDPEGGFQSIPNGDIVVVKKCICGMIPCHCEVKKRKVEAFLANNNLSTYPPNFHFFRLSYFKTFEDIVSLSMLRTDYFTLYQKCLASYCKETIGILISQSWVKNYFTYLKNSKSSLDKFLLEIKEFTKGINIHDINICNKKPPELLKTIYYSLQGVFQVSPRIRIKDDQFVDELMIFDGKQTFKKIYGNNDYFNREVYYPEVNTSQYLSETFIFCPVALRDYNILWRGKLQYHTKLEYRDVFLSCDEAYKRFLNDSSLYLPNRSTPVLPPLRIFITGPPGSGKNEIGGILAQHLSLEIINFEKIFNEVLTSGRTKYVSRNASAKKSEFDFEEEENFGWTNFYSTDSTDSLKIDLESVVEINEDTSETTKLQEKYFQSDKPFALTRDMYKKLLTKYMCTGSGIPNKILKLVFDSFWNKYKKGFILIGFPFHSWDLNFMTIEHFIPDLIIYLNVNEKEAVRRKFRTEYEFQSKHLKEKIKNKQDYEVEAFKNWNENRNRYFWFLADKYGVVVEDHEEEEENFDEIRYIPYDRMVSGMNHLPTIINLIEERYPIPVFKTTAIETPEDMKRRIKIEIRHLYDYHESFLPELKYMVTSELIPCYIAFSKTDHLFLIAIEILAYIEQKKLPRNESFMSFSILHLQDAIHLLSEGYLSLSPSGFYCPVQNQIAQNPLFMFNTGLRNKEVCCVINRNKVYYVRGVSRFFSFTHESEKYITKRPKQQYHSQFRVAINGHAKSGKTALAYELEDKYNVEVITLGSAIRNILKNYSNTTLREVIHKQMARGNALCHKLEAGSIYLAIQTPDCILQGFVFDGFPTKKLQFKEFENLNLVPLAFCFLETTLEHIESNYSLENYLYRDNFPKYPHSFLISKYNSLLYDMDAFCKDLFLNSYNLFSISTYESYINNFLAITQVIFDCMYQWILYDQKKDNTEEVVNVGISNVSMVQFKKYQTVFRKMCPVCYDCSMVACPQNREDFIRGVVQYKECYYWVCRLHEEHFYFYPDRYINVDKGKIPKIIPQFIGTTDWLIRTPYLFGKGFCIICLLRTYELDNLCPGHNTYSVEFCGVTFKFCSKICLLKFIQTPDYFLKTALRRLNISKMASLDFIFTDNPEGCVHLHELHSVITLALFQLNNYRPRKYPFSSEVTAALFVGYFLKIHAHQKDYIIAKKWEKAFQKFLNGIRNYLICLTKQKHLMGTRKSVIELGKAKLAKLIQDERMEEETASGNLKNVCPSDSQISYHSGFSLKMDNNEEELHPDQDEDHFEN